MSICQEIPRIREFLYSNSFNIWRKNRIMRKKDNWIVDKTLLFEDTIRSLDVNRKWMFNNSLNSDLPQIGFYVTVFYTIFVIWNCSKCFPKKLSLLNCWIVCTDTLIHKHRKLIQYVFSSKTIKMIVQRVIAKRENY